VALPALILSAARTPEPVAVRTNAHVRSTAIPGNVQVASR
jgi:hypothetical protein